MINCLVVDDEPLAIEILENFVNKIPFLNLLAKHNEPLQALSHTASHEIDLLFLDINMPDISGIEFFKSLAVKPEVIFTTAYSEYALQGFELQALDYLLKPISFERFVSAVNRAKEIIESRRSQPGNSRDYFFINITHTIHKVFYNEILYLEGCKDYTKIYLSTATSPLVVLNNLKYYEEFLGKRDFVRIHRSYIVSISKLNTITRRLVNIGNKQLPVSDHYRDQLFSLIG